MTPARMEALEYAALLSGVGQLALADPSPGGASLLRSREERQQAAEIEHADVRKRTCQILLLVCCAILR